MVTQWISAATARSILAEQSHDDAAEKALIARAHVGLLKTRALRMDMVDGKAASGVMPVEFWWPEAMQSLVQDWAVGDMWNRINGRDCRAYGVQFDLDGVIQMLPPTRAATIARQLSVAGDPDWVNAKAARAFMYDDLRVQPVLAGGQLIDECRLGFVAGRAVLMQRADGQRPDDWTVEAREWDIPNWFWQDFTTDGSSSQDWTRGVFAGRGRGPAGRCWMTLTGVYFARSSLDAMIPTKNPQVAMPAPRAVGGRPPAAFWDDLWCAVWGDVHRGDLQPTRPADVYNAMMKWIVDNGHMAAESVVKLRARKMFAAYQREDGNHPQA